MDNLDAFVKVRQPNTIIRSFTTIASPVCPTSRMQNEAPPAEAFKVYKPSTRSAVVPDLPDSYFTPTLADLKAAQAVLSARTQALVNAPLELRAAREARDVARRDRWPQTTIRVRFTDRTQLERTFPSTDKIRSVYAFVRSVLREDVKPIKFILYQSPPKRDLKVSDPSVRDLTLSELQLAPSSILLLRFLDDSLNATNYPAPLASSVLAQAVEVPLPASLPVSEPSGQRPIHAKSSNTATTSGNRIPKWMKLGLKK